MANEETINQLRSAAREVAQGSIDQDWSEIAVPPWDECKRTHDWKNYVPESICEVWDTLPIEAKLVCYILCKQLASNEDWE